MGSVFLLCKKECTGNNCSTEKSITENSNRETAMLKIVDYGLLFPSCLGLCGVLSWGWCDVHQDSQISTFVSSSDLNESEDLDSKWVNWLVSMKESYQLGMYQDHIAEQLDQAVFKEDFQAAVKFKEIATRLQSDDVVDRLKEVSQSFQAIQYIPFVNQTSN